MTEDEVLDIIASHPGDDAPRLLYADMLKRRGDPRGEFIQVQCTLAKLPPDDPEASALAARERELLEAYGAPFHGAWLAPISHRYDTEFERGFVVRDDCNQKSKVDSIARYLSAAEDTLRLVLDESVELAAKSWNQSDEDWAASDDTWRALVNHRVLGRWRWLTCYREDVDAVRLGVLVTSPHLRRLESLYLGCPVGLDGLAAVAASPNMRSLRALYPSDGIGGDEAAHVLARSPVLALEAFGWRVPMSDAGLGVLTGSPVFRRLSHLVLGLSPRASAEGLARLLESIEGPLRSIKIDGAVSRFDACLQHLCGTPTLRHLQSLDICDAPVTDEGLALLLGSTGDELSELLLDVELLSEAGFEMLLASRLSSDMDLNLYGTPENAALRARLRARFPSFDANEY